ncbi:MAG: Tat pathway signal protein [Ruminococcaceae bacterium]|nr:Tat pathway signal protein [Oscillospiraceae bacterium]
MHAFPSIDKPFGDTYEKAGTDGGPKALAKGWVVVIPGVRGHDNQSADGRYYGKAPASIVDLKAVVRYLRYNRGIVPGDPEKIFASGGSAAGALASLMAVSGNYPWYEPYLKEIGAADERDDVFGCLSFCPITDLSHADGAYEWQYGGLKAESMFAPQPLEMDAEVTNTLAEQFRKYINGKGLKGKNGFGTISSDNLADYILKEYLVPSCERFLKEKDEGERTAYLSENPWIKWDGEKVEFSFEDFVVHCGRSKTQPAFDDKEMQMEPAIFGTEKVNGRHFTDFGLKYATGDPDAKVEDEVVQLENMMNAMYFLPGKADMAKHWWIRHGACDKDTSLPIITNLATALENAGANVNARLVWDGGHGADDDKFEMMDWIESVI